MTRVKICGIRSLDEARAVIDAGADALGFHVDLEHAKCLIGAATVNAIISRLPPYISTVVVTTETDVKRLLKLAKGTAANTFQLHGDISPESVRAVKAMIFYMKIIVAIHVDNQALEKVKAFEDAADGILLDRPNLATGAHGGSGKTHDWELSRKIVESTSVPIILAGGLNPENVKEAIEKVRSYAVDVNTGVSNQDGTKDIEKIKHFVQRAKSI